MNSSNQAEKPVEISDRRPSENKIRIAPARPNKTNGVSHASILGHKIPAKQKKRGMDKVVLRSCMYVKK
jgi:hypothetical protein